MSLYYSVVVVVVVVVVIVVVVVVVKCPCNFHYHRTPLQWRTRDYSCHCPCLNLSPMLSLENGTRWDEEKRRWKEVKDKDHEKKVNNAKDNWKNNMIYLQASKSSLNLSSVNSSRRSLNSFVQPNKEEVKLTTLVKLKPLSGIWDSADPTNQLTRDVAGSGPKFNNLLLLFNIIII